MGQPPDPQPAPARRARRPLLRNEIISQALLDPGERAAIGLPDGQDQDPVLPVVIELNLQYQDGLDAVTERFAAKWTAVIGTPPVLVTTNACALTLPETVVGYDTGPGGVRARADGASERPDTAKIASSNPPGNTTRTAP